MVPKYKTISHNYNNGQTERESFNKFHKDLVWLDCVENINEWNTREQWIKSYKTHTKHIAQNAVNLLNHYMHE